MKISPGKLDKELQPSNTEGLKGPLVTIFCIPRSFEGKTAIRQENAISSWCRLRPYVDVVLMGDEPGVRKMASKMRTVHIVNVERNSLGTPLLSDAFAKANKICESPFLAYFNADIILIDDFVQSMRQLAKSELGDFLAIGRRIELDLDRPIDFSNNKSVNALVDLIESKGRYASILCKDYFVFRRGCFRSIPEFAIGRGNWDNWLVFHAKRNRIPVVDLTRSTTAVHSIHQYEHVPGGRGKAYISGPEAKENQKLAGGRHLISGSTANWQLDSNGLSRKKMPSRAFFADLPHSVKLVRKLLFC